MKIILIGASGTIGQAVKKALNAQHDVISVGLTTGDHQVDITDETAIKRLFQSIGSFDALIATTGKVAFAELMDFDKDKWQLGLNNKLMGQVNLVMHGIPYISEGGSFTLTSGLLNHDPIKLGASAAMVNGALEGFVTGASIELPKKLRLNLVSPGAIKESFDTYEPYFKGYIPVAAAEVAQAYVKSVAGLQTGKVFRVGW